ncbi:MFS transporter [Neisseriaceae bacterium JH1-16]|nr:MFS transporter [Neisseriaceae bacterium JH1-16]
MNQPLDRDSAPPRRLERLSRPLLLAGLMLVALNLRPALASLGPLLDEITAALGLSASAAGLLATIPVFCLGLSAPLAPRLSARFGAERVILFALVLLAAGTALRGVSGAEGLFAGTILAGASIGVMGVLLPGLVKRDFAGQAHLMTGLYTMALCLGAALAAGLTVPASDAGGGHWQVGLGIWALPALLAALLWWPQGRQAHDASARRAPQRGLWRDPIAWQVTGYMGLQSSHAYIVFSWFPAMMVDRGLSPLAAGWMLSLLMLAQLVSSLGAPWLSSHCRDQRLVIVAMLALSMIGFSSALYAPLDGLWLWTTLMGLGLGGMFSMGLTLIVLRAPSAQLAAQLSGMAQGAGYLLASTGPFLVGLSHDLLDNWHGAYIVYMVFGAAALLFGLLAGRERQIGAEEPH